MPSIVDLRQVIFLVVDDSAFSRSIVKLILRTLGAEPANIHETANGFDALKALETFKPDIAIVDYMMESMDGIELTKTIRRKEGVKFQTIPIIMLSAYSEMGLVSKARNAGVNEYLAKPVSVEDLYLRIEEVIRRPRKFVFAENFCGPDRHRHPDEDYDGPRRRESDRQNEVDEPSAKGLPAAQVAKTEEPSAVEA